MPQRIEKGARQRLHVSCVIVTFELSVAKPFWINQREATNPNPKPDQDEELPPTTDHAHRRCDGGRM